MGSSLIPETPVKKTFSEWNDIFEKERRYKVMDPDGFDRAAPDFDTRLYTRSEFNDMAMFSTCQFFSIGVRELRHDVPLISVEEVTERLNRIDRVDPTSKPTNPKDIVGSGKLPLHLVSPALPAAASVGLLNGLLKYGRSNYRETGVRASIYYDALVRHMNAWFDGEWEDPDDNVPHLCAAAACLNIILDAYFQDKLEDDRNYSGQAHRRAVEVFTPYVQHLKELHADKTPAHHYTIADDAAGYLTEQGHAALGAMLPEEAIG